MAVNRPLYQEKDFSDYFNTNATMQKVIDKVEKAADRVLEMMETISPSFLPFVPYSTSIIMGAVLGAVSLTVLDQWKKYKSRPFKTFTKKFMKEFPSDSWVFYQLMDSETNMLYVTPIPTVSFYKGDLDSSLISNRLEEILTVNPWLAGRLTRSHDLSLASLHSEHFDRSTLSRYYQEIVIDNTKLSKEKRFHETSSLEVLLSHVESYFVKKGIDCINKDEVLFKVVVIKVMDNNDDNDDGGDVNNNDAAKGEKKKELSIIRTVVLVCMSHVLGDGYTYYNIFSSLDRSKEIVRLNAFRKSDIFLSKMEEIQGSAYMNLLKSPLLFGCFMWNILFASQPTIQFYKVNNEIIKKMKSQFQTSTNDGSMSPSLSLAITASEKKDSSFVSTNDILSSWFFQKCQSTYGFIAINARNRIKELGNTLAGKYVTLIFYDPEDYSDPRNIRRSLPRLSSHKEAGQSKVLSIWDYVKFNVASVTNWATFFHQVEYNIEKNPFIIHYPLISKKECGTKDFLVIFAPKKDEIGLFLMSRSLNEEKDWLTSSNEQLISKYFK
jgi:hypothetical protein